MSISLKNNIHAKVSPRRVLSWLYGSSSRQQEIVSFPATTALSLLPERWLSVCHSLLQGHYATVTIVLRCAPSSLVRRKECRTRYGRWL
ncbi:hypothetical protein SERLA73DRAFT_135168, partial [Serpula lacrymans var. lacrymans S7.3]